MSTVNMGKGVKQKHWTAATFLRKFNWAKHSFLFYTMCHFPLDLIWADEECFEWFDSNLLEQFEENKVRSGLVKKKGHSAGSNKGKVQNHKIKATHINTKRFPTWTWPSVYKTIDKQNIESPGSIKKDFIAFCVSQKKIVSKIRMWTLKTKALSIFFFLGK